MVGVVLVVVFKSKLQRSKFHIIQDSKRPSNHHHYHHCQRWTLQEALTAIIGRMCIRIRICTRRRHRGRERGRGMSIRWRAW